MPIYHQGRKVKEVYHQGRKVKEIWHMGRIIWSALPSGFEMFLTELQSRMQAHGRGASTETIAPVEGNLSELHMLVDGNSSATLTQPDSSGSSPDRRALHIEVRNGTIYAESTNWQNDNSRQTATLQAPWPGGAHVVTLTTKTVNAYTYQVNLLIDGRRVAQTENKMSFIYVTRVFSDYPATVTTVNTLAWGIYTNAGATDGTWVASTLQPAT